MILFSFLRGAHSLSRAPPPPPPSPPYGGTHFLLHGSRTRRVLADLYPRRYTLPILGSSDLRAAASIYPKGGSPSRSGIRAWHGGGVILGQVGQSEGRPMASGPMEGGSAFFVPSALSGIPLSGPPLVWVVGSPSVGRAVDVTRTASSATPSCRGCDPHPALSLGAPFGEFLHSPLLTGGPKRYIHKYISV